MILYFLFFFLSVTIHDLFIFKLIAILLLFIYLIYRKKLKLSHLIFILLGLIINFFLVHNLFASEYGFVILSKENYLILQTINGRYYVYNSENTYQVFDILKVTGNIEKLNFKIYESQFDFNNYLNQQFVYNKINNAEISNIFIGPFRIKYIIENVTKNLNEDAKNIVNLLLFNVKSDRDLVDAISDNNINYYLSLSSYHLYFIFDIIERFIVIKFDDKKTKKCLLFVILGFIIITNYKTSIIRLFVYKILLYLNQFKWNFKYAKRELIFLLFLTLGIINPSYLMGTTFLFTFPLYLLLCEISFPLKNLKKKYRGLTYLLIIQFYIIVVSYLLNDQISLFSSLYGVLFGPIVLLFFLISLIHMIIPVNSLINAIAKMINTSINLFSSFNLVLYSNKYDVVLFVISLIILYLILYFIFTSRSRKTIYLIYTLIVILFLPCIPLNSLHLDMVAFINVGQGDSILIKNKNINILIDTGGVKDMDLAKETLIPFFKKNQIYHIDYLITTHDDFDHSGCKDSLLNNFKVNYYFDNNTYQDLYFDSFSLINLNKNSKLHADENDSSLVLYLKFYSHTFLLMGDASKGVEKDIITNHSDLRCDYIKIGHHGSSTSTSEEFIKVVSPKEAIISVGRNNYYKHPSSEVLNILDKYQIKVRRTDIEGTIKYIL